MKQQVQIYSFEMAQFYWERDWRFIQKDILAQKQQKVVRQLFFWQKQAVTDILMLFSVLIPREGQELTSRRTLWNLYSCFSASHDKFSSLLAP